MDPFGRANHLDAFDLIELLDPALYLPRFGGLVPELPDEALHFFDLLGLALLRGYKLLLPCELLRLVLVVIADVQGEAAQLQFGDSVHHPV